jgi:hypothetical protein
MHPIQASYKRRFPAARRADERRGVVRLHDNVDVEQCLRLAVKRIQVLDCDSDAHKLVKLQKAS